MFSKQLLIGCMSIVYPLITLGNPFQNQFLPISDSTNVKQPSYIVKECPSENIKIINGKNLNEFYILAKEQVVVESKEEVRPKINNKTIFPESDVNYLIIKNKNTPHSTPTYQPMLAKSENIKNILKQRMLASANKRNYSSRHMIAYNKIKHKLFSRQYAAHNYHANHFKRHHKTFTYQHFVMKKSMKYKFAKNRISKVIYKV